MGCACVSERRMLISQGHIVIVVRSDAEERATYIVYVRALLSMLLALSHRSLLLVRLQRSSSRVIRSISSCFLPALVKLVLHCSLKLRMICLRRSTVLSFTLWRMV